MSAYEVACYARARALNYDRRDHVSCSTTAVLYSYSHPADAFIQYSAQLLSLLSWPMSKPMVLHLKGLGESATSTLSGCMNFKE